MHKFVVNDCFFGPIVLLSVDDAIVFSNYSVHCGLFSDSSGFLAVTFLDELTDHLQPIVKL